MTEREDGLLEIIMNMASQCDYDQYLPHDNAPNRHGKRCAVASAKVAGRNAPCPCGSGKKYKLCCLRKKKETK